MRSCSAGVRGAASHSCNCCMPCTLALLLFARCLAPYPGMLGGRRQEGGGVVIRHSPSPHLHRAQPPLQPPSLFVSPVSTPSLLLNTFQCWYQELLPILSRGPMHPRGAPQDRGAHCQARPSPAHCATPVLINQQGWNNSTRPPPSTPLPPLFHLHLLPTPSSLLPSPPSRAGSMRRRL